MHKFYFKNKETEWYKVRRYVETRVQFERIIQRKVKEKGSGFQFTSCERVAETYKMKQTKLNVNGRV